MRDNDAAQRLNDARAILSSKLSLIDREQPPEQNSKSPRSDSNLDWNVLGLDNAVYGAGNSDVDRTDEPSSLVCDLW